MDLDIRIDRASSRPIYQQVAAALREGVGAGRLTDGTRLPSTRSLAHSLGVHRNTVVEAYRMLEREGRVRSGVGAGTFVCAPARAAASAREASGGQVFHWGRLLRDGRAAEAGPSRWLAPRASGVAPDPIQLTGAIADRRQFPLEDFASCMRGVLADADAGALDYGTPEGDESLRGWVVDWLRAAGVEGLDCGRVFIVSGSQQGLDLLARLLLAPGDAVVVEAPTYHGACAALSQAGARLPTVPLDPEGLSLDALQERVAEDEPKFLYTMPGFQNPTGITLSPARRAALLQLARRERLAIVEDHFDSELYYAGERPRPLLADDPDGQVIHLGTFSKMLFPGLRLGWLVVPPGLVEPVRRLRWAADLSSATLAQRAMDRFCRSGCLERHLTRIRRVNARRLEAMLRALAERFPREARWTRPTGGLTLWVDLPEAVDTLELFEAAAARGVLFSPGTLFYPDGGGRHGMRLSFNRESEARIARGVEVLGRMIGERLRARRGRRAPRDAAVPLP
jgi:DNA-binding transcriptional MocR family regulator